MVQNFEEILKKFYSMDTVDEDFKTEILNILNATEHMISLVTNGETDKIHTSDPHNDLFVEQFNSLVAIYQRHHVT